MAVITGYVVGFLYNEARDSVALIKKNKPEWQKGLLNGIGGKIEIGEWALDAMKREFNEEAGMIIDNWELFCRMEFNEALVFCYSATGDLTKIKQMTDEVIELHTVQAVSRLDVIPNLKWLVPLGADQNRGIINVVPNCA